METIGIWAHGVFGIWLVEDRRSQDLQATRQKIVNCLQPRDITPIPNFVLFSGSTTRTKPVPCLLGLTTVPSMVLGSTERTNDEPRT